jgi:hypothetical protein
MSSRAFRGGSSNFNAGRMARGDRGFSRRGRGGPVVGSNNWNRHDGRHHHRRNRIIIGAPYFYDDYAYGYGDCGWLYSRAVQTGSAYWWRRYEVCEG